METVQRKIKELAGLHVSRRAIAKVLGVSREAVSNWAKGKTGSDFGEQQLADALDAIKERVTCGSAWVGKLEPMKLKRVNRRSVEYARLPIEQSRLIVEGAITENGSAAALVRNLKGLVSLSNIPLWKAKGITLSPKGVKFLAAVGYSGYDVVTKAKQ